MDENDKTTIAEPQKKLREAMSRIYDLEEKARELGNRCGNAEIGITAMRKRAAGLEAENTALKDAIRLAAEKLNELAERQEKKAESLELSADSPAEAGEKDNAARDFKDAARELRKAAWELERGE